MILVDSSVWIDHLHTADADLVDLLEGNEVAVHPMIIGELALGSIAERGPFLGLLEALPSALEASHSEVLSFVTERRIHGRGLSLVDAHLLTSVVLDSHLLVWTRDRRLARAAAELRVAWHPRGRVD